MGSLAGRSWLDHKNQTLSAVVFLDRPSAVDWPTRCAGQNVSDEHAVYPSGDCALPDILRYKVYYNDTTRYSRASRTYTPFYPLDATREVQRAVDEAVIADMRTIADASVEYMSFIVCAYCPSSAMASSFLAGGDASLKRSQLSRKAACDGINEYRCR